MADEEEAVQVPAAEAAEAAEEAAEVVADPIPPVVPPVVVQAAPVIPPVVDPPAIVIPPAIVPHLPPPDPAGEAIAAAEALVRQQHADLDAAVAALAALRIPGAALVPAVPHAQAAAAAAAPARGFLPARRQGRKLTPFKTGSSSDWYIWRRNFNVVRQINEWPDQLARLELMGAMEAPAGHAVSDLDWTSANNCEALLNLFEERFLPTAASDYARVIFSQAQQASGESVLAWHGRLREYFVRAYPRDEFQHSVQLIHKFCLGLAGQSVKEHTWRQRPGTYTAALNHATNEEAAVIVLAPSNTPAGIRLKKEHGLHALLPKPPLRPRVNKPDRIVTCYNCNEAGHFKRDCPKAIQERGQDGSLPGRGGAGKRPGKVVAGRSRQAVAKPKARHGIHQLQGEADESPCDGSDCEWIEEDPLWAAEN